jgi:16S rRNA (uracil1498-N3)-methyltransferase
MRVSRIFTEQDLAAGARVEMDERACRYASQVLRLRAGQSVVLFNGSGSDYAAELTRCDRRRCTAEVTQLVASEQPTALQLHLGIGISRGERMDLAIQKSVELGVHAISPLMTARSVVQLKQDRVEKRMAHWRGIIISACEQSGRSRLPGLAPPASLGDWLAAHPGGLQLQHAAADSLAGIANPGPSLNLLIGPEGGLSDAEQALASAAGFKAVRLGPRVLRTETAPIAALAAIQVLWGDFR